MKAYFRLTLYIYIWHYAFWISGILKKENLLLYWIGVILLNLFPFDTIDSRLVIQLWVKFLNIKHAGFCIFLYLIFQERKNKFWFDYSKSNLIYGNRKKNTVLDNDRKCRKVLRIRTKRIKDSFSLSLQMRKD